MFQGSMVAIATPMTNDGEIDFVRYDDLLAFHLANQTDAIVVAGTTGEFGALMPQEYEKLVRRTVKQVAGKSPVIVGSGTVSTAKTISLTQQVMQWGADASLLLAPPYVKPTQEGLFQHFASIAHQVALPQILYNVPSRTACDISPKTVARLADIPNIVGIKEATGSLQRMLDIKALCGDRLDIYSGDDATAKDWLMAGAKGVISVTANVAPQLMHELCVAASQQDQDKVNEIDNKLSALHENLFVESNPIPVKWCLHRMGFMEPQLRLPLTILSSEYHPLLERSMQQAGVTL